MDTQEQIGETMEVQKDLLEKQKMKNFSHKKSQWTPKSKSFCVKEMEVQKDSLEKQKARSFNEKKSWWTPKNNYMKEWKFKKIYLRSKR